MQQCTLQSDFLIIYNENTVCSENLSIRCFVWYIYIYYVIFVCVIKQICTKAIDKYNLIRHNMYRL